MVLPKVLLTYITLVIASCAAHSWVERLMRISPANGTMIGSPGYIRGAVSRYDPGFSDLQMQHLLPPNDGRLHQALRKSDPMCRNTQPIGNYTREFPRLQAHPGDYVALQHQENGHVTLLVNTPQKNSSGQIYIYGTSWPSNDDSLLSIHKVWNEDGTGGDGRGQLLAVRPFDDGRCYQVNSGTISKARQQRYLKMSLDPQGADLWCQSDIRLPVDIKHNYTLYWVWDWPSQRSEGVAEVSTEIYTSCLDIEVLPGAQEDEVSFMEGQDMNFAGIEAQLLDS